MNKNLVINWLKHPCIKAICYDILVQTKKLLVIKTDKI